MRDELHVEGLRQPEHFRADVADTERAQNLAATRPTPMCSPRAAKPGGPCRASLSLIIILPVRARMKVMIETATGRLTPSGVMTSAISFAVQAARPPCRSRRRSGRRRRAGRSSARCLHRTCGRAGSAHRNPRADRPAADWRFRGTPSRHWVLIQRFEIEIRKGRRAIRLLEITRKCDAECAHPFAPSRMVLAAAASPSRSTHTSPE
jgi:hypothetical protein